LTDTLSNLGTEAGFATYYFTPLIDEINCLGQQVELEVQIDPYLPITEISEVICQNSPITFDQQD